MNDIPAFPRPSSGTVQYAQTGMTLRDFFAAKAMQALINKGGSFVVVPTQAYAIADVMMQARGETK